MAAATAATGQEELVLWEHALFGNLQPGACLASNGIVPTSEPAPDGCFQVNQSHYVPEGLDQLIPDGLAELPPGANYIKDEEHGWCYGQVDGDTGEQMQQFKDMLLQHKDSFAYSMQDLPGYMGHLLSSLWCLMHVHSTSVGSTVH